MSKVIGPERLRQLLVLLKAQLDARAVIDDTQSASTTTYSSSKIEDIISQIHEFDQVVVDELPQTGVEGTLYFVRRSGASGEDVCDEYLWIEDESKFEKVGSTAASYLSSLLDVNVTSVQNNQELVYNSTTQKWEPKHRVSANPTLSGTEDELSSVKIDNVAYSIKGQSIQYATLPEPSSSVEGKIVQYVGETTSDFTNGRFYKCTEISTDAYGWVSVEVSDTYELPAATAATLGGVKVDSTTITATSDGTISATPYILPVATSALLGGIKVDNNTTTIDGEGVLSAEKVQYSTLPEPAADLAGQIVQYVGETDSDFINGRFYKCVKTGSIADATKEMINTYPRTNFTFTAEVDHDIYFSPISPESRVHIIFWSIDGVNQDDGYWITSSGPSRTYHVTSGHTYRFWDSTAHVMLHYQVLEDVYSWLLFEVADRYELPVASTATLGGVKIDNDTVVIDGNGVISATANVIQVTEFPTASAENEGMIRQYVGLDETTYHAGTFYKSARVAVPVTAEIPSGSFSYTIPYNQTVTLTLECLGTAGHTGACSVSLNNTALSEFTGTFTEAGTVSDDIFCNANDIISGSHDAGLTLTLSYSEYQYAWIAIGASAIETLNDIGDVNVTAVTDGQALVYDSAQQLWVPGAAGDSEWSASDVQDIIDAVTV